MIFIDFDINQHHQHQLIGQFGYIEIQTPELREKKLIHPST